MISGHAKIAAIIGDPVGHSLSPYIHHYWLKQYKIDGAYAPFKVSKENLNTVLNAMKQMGFVGCNITIPHKETVASVIAHQTDAAKQIGAVNTLIRDDHGNWIGDNTDGDGFYCHLKQTYPDKTAHLKTAMVIGAGGASRAIIFALQHAGIERVLVVNRTQEKTHILVKDFCVVAATEWQHAEQAMAECDIIINTSSLGMVGYDPLTLSLKHAPAHAIVADIVYRPLMTQWLQQAQSRQLDILTGIGMLLHQAVPGFKAWFGVRPEVTPALEMLILQAASQ